MKTLQNNFTTPEQSNRLLELGVPADSADCYIRLDFNVTESPDVIRYGATFSEIRKRREIITDNFIPCWSVGRMMEICDICILAGGGKKGEFYFDHNGLNKTYVQDMVDTIEGMLKLKLIDFSKL